MVRATSIATSCTTRSATSCSVRSTFVRNSHEANAQPSAKPMLIPMTMNTMPVNHIVYFFTVTTSLSSTSDFGFAFATSALHAVGNALTCS